MRERTLLGGTAAIAALLIVVGCQAGGMGLAVYPGAKKVNAGQTTFTSGLSGQVKFVDYEANAKFDAVAKFYKDKYAQGAEVRDFPNSLTITLTHDQGGARRVTVESGFGSSKTSIRLARLYPDKAKSSH